MKNLNNILEGMFDVGDMASQMNLQSGVIK